MHPGRGTQGGAQIATFSHILAISGNYATSATSLLVFVVSWPALASLGPPWDILAPLADTTDPPGPPIPPPPPLRTAVFWGSREGARRVPGGCPEVPEVSQGLENTI